MSTHQKSQCRAPEGPNPASRKKQERRAQHFPENSCSGQGGQVWGLRRDESGRLDRQIPFWKMLGKDRRRKIVAGEERGGERRRRVFQRNNDSGGTVRERAQEETHTPIPTAPE